MVMGTMKAVGGIERAVSVLLMTCIAVEELYGGVAGNVATHSLVVPSHRMYPCTCSWPISAPLVVRRIYQKGAERSISHG